MAELDTVKANVATQTVTCIQLQAAVTQQGGLCATLNETVSSLVEASNVVATQPNLPQDIATDRSPAPAIRPAYLPAPAARFIYLFKKNIFIQGSTQSYNTNSVLQCCPVSS